jgi:hypothetical protein
MRGDVDDMPRSKEAHHVFYAQNTFDFDIPLSLLLFTDAISPSSLSTIRSLSFSLQIHLYSYKPSNPSTCKSFHPDQWLQMWEVISKMQGLEKIRVHFRSPIDGWCGWSEKEVLGPLWRVRKRPLNGFDVEAPLGLFGDAETDLRLDEEGREAPFRLLGSNLTQLRIRSW